MFQRILVPLDGSAHAERAIPAAARIARATGGTLIFLHVVFSPAQTGIFSFESLAEVETHGDEKRRAQAEEYLSHLVSTVYANDLAGLATEKEVISGAIASGIFAPALLEKIDVIVMCSHEETGLKRWIVGSMTHEAVRHTPVPLIVLHEQGRDLPLGEKDQPIRILVPLDGSRLSESALTPAAQLSVILAGHTPAAIHLLRVVDVPPTTGKFKAHFNVDALIQDELRQEALTYLHRLEAQIHEQFDADHPLLVTSSAIVHASAARTIVEIAEQEGEQNEPFTLIAMATHGRTGLMHLMMGSVTEQVLSQTKLPMLIIRPHEQAGSSQATQAREASGSHADEVSLHFRGKSNTSIQLSERSE